MNIDIIQKFHSKYAKVEVEGAHTKGHLIIDWLGFSQQEKNVLILTEID